MSFCVDSVLSIAVGTKLCVKYHQEGKKKTLVVTALIKYTWP